MEWMPKDSDALDFIIDHIDQIETVDEVSCVAHATPGWKAERDARVQRAIEITKELNQCKETSLKT